MNQFEQLARTRKAAAILSVLRRAQGAEVSDATLLSYLERRPDAFARAAIVAGVRPPSAETRAMVVEMIRGSQLTDRRASR